MKNSNGPNTEPCGILAAYGFQSEEEDPTNNICITIRYRRTRLVSL